MSDVEKPQYTFGSSVDELQISLWLNRTVNSEEVNKEVVRDAAKRLRTAAIFNTPIAADILQLIEDNYRGRASIPDASIKTEADYNAAVALVSEVAMRRMGVYETYVRLSEVAGF